MKLFGGRTRDYTQGLISLGGHLPALAPKSQKFLAKILPWAYLVGAIMSLWTAWSLWQETHRPNTLPKDDSPFFKNINQNTEALTGLNFWLEMGLLILLAVGLIVCFLRLQHKLASGWRRALVDVNIALLAYAAITSQTETASGMSWPALVALAFVNYYVLLQTRGYFNEKPKILKKPKKKKRNQTPRTTA